MPRIPHGHAAVVGSTFAFAFVGAFLHFFDTLLPDFELLAKKARPPTIRPKLAPNMGFPPLPLCLLRTKSVRHIACGAFSYSIALVQCNAGI